MEKKKNIKTRFMAGALALILSGSPMSLVKAEEQIVKSEQAVQIIEQAENLENIIRHPHLHKYVSEDGVDFKWICSEEPIVDGLNWTEETMDFDFSFEKDDYKEHLEKYECPVEQYHQHLYGLMPYGAYESAREEFLCLEILEDRDIKWAEENLFGFSNFIKSPVIMTYSEQDYKMMNDLQIWPTIFRCMERDLYEKMITDGSLKDFKLLVLSIKDMGDHYIVDEKLVSRDELADNATEYPYVPYISQFSDTYQSKTDYKVYKKTK